jgi:hypothetical protein
MGVRGLVNNSFQGLWVAPFKQRRATRLVNQEHKRDHEDDLLGKQETVEPQSTAGWVVFLCFAKESGSKTFFCRRRGNESQISSNFCVNIRGLLPRLLLFERAVRHCFALGHHGNPVAIHFPVPPHSKES